MSYLSDGHLVELRTSPLDWRDYGDKEAIHNGNILDWWNGMDWQTVRYESAGRAHAFLVMKDDTTHTLACATRWFRWVRQGIRIQTQWIRTRYAWTVLYQSSTLHTP